MTLPPFLAQLPEADWAFYLQRLDQDTYVYDNQRGEVSLLDRATLGLLLDQMLRRKQ